MSLVYTVVVSSTRGSPACEKFLRQNRIPTDSPLAESIRGIGTNVELSFNVYPDGSHNVVSINGTPIEVAPPPSNASEEAANIEALLSACSDDPIKGLNAEATAQLMGEKAAVARAKDANAPTGCPFPLSSEAGKRCAKAWVYGYARVADVLLVER
jgi:hypothetical protein